MILWLALGAACTPGSSGGLDTGPIDCAPQGALVGTATDYQAGALWSYDPVGDALDDALAPASGDPLVVADGCRVFVLERGGADSLRAYAPGRYGAPRWERALPPGANAHAARRFGDQVWVTAFGLPELLAFDLEHGDPVAAVDLTAWADADGVPEAHSLVAVDGALVVALQRFRRDLGWAPEPGALVWVDPASGAVTRTLETGPSPTLLADPDPAAGLWLHTGVWFDDDGVLARLDPSTGAIQAVATEAELGGDLAAFAPDGQGGVVLVVAPPAGGDWAVRCLRASGEVLGAWTTDAFVSDVQIDGRGHAWVALRASWTAGASDPTGLLGFDLASCAPLSPSPTSLLLEPYSIAAY